MTKIDGIQLIGLIGAIFLAHDLPKPARIGCAIIFFGVAIIGELL